MLGSTGDERLIPLLEMTSPRSSRAREWVAVKNLDNFFQKIYEYFEERGFWRMVITRVTSLLILAFTVVFSTFLLLFVNWNELLNCHTARSCSKINIIRSDPFARHSMLNVLAGIYFVVFFLYWIWNLISFLHCLRDGFEMRSFYRQKLGISDEELQTMEWSEVVDRIQQLQMHFKISIIKDHDALDISNRIMRKDNFLIAMVSGGVLDLKVPFLSSELHVSPILGKSLEWNIRFCVLDSMFHDEMFTIREEFFQEPQKLRKLLMQMAIANFVLMPFILVFMVIFFFLQNAEELHSRKSYLGPRQWSLLAEWTFREFNEVPHIFKNRMDESNNDALAYINQFPVPAPFIFAQFFAYVAGAVVAVLLLITASDSAILMEIQFLNHSLLYYLLTCTAILAVCRSISPRPKANQDFNVLMSNIFRHTHHQPRLWRERPQSSVVRSQFAKLYPFKLVLFFQEVLCVLVTPLVLGITLPRATEKLTEFIRQNTVRLDGVGDVCAFAAYDFSFFRHNGNSALREKMEKSLVSFAMTHPKWRPDRTGASLLINLADQAEHRLHHPRHTSHTYARSDDDVAAGELSESTQALAMNVSDIVFSKKVSVSKRKKMHQALIESVVLSPGERSPERE